MDFEQKMKLIRYNFEMEGYTIVVKECVSLIEHVLRQLFSQYLTQLYEQDRPQRPKGRNGDRQRAAGDRALYAGRTRRRLSEVSFPRSLGTDLE